MNSMLRHVYAVLCIATSLGASQATGWDSNTDLRPQTTPAPSLTNSVASSAGLLSTNSTGICSSRTVNYITNTLARQCLRTGRVPSHGPHHAAQTTNGTHPVATGIPADASVQYLTRSGNAENTTGASSASGEQESGPALGTTLSVATPGVGDSAAPTPSIEGEEGESALDNANFLSFEEWKKQNLAKSGQSPEDLGRTQTSNAPRPRPVNNALDTLGDEQEIDIDFVGFGGTPQSEAPEQSTASPDSAANSDASPPTSLRSKDAGKTCKERTNYASFDCAATVLKTNKEAKSATSVLVESKDSYMLNKCLAENKFFIVELCNDIQIDTVVLANYEFFSSGFRHFRLSVSDRYPVKMEKWRDLGTFEARNTREIQAFLIENPQIWARYLRIEFLTHYGSEYYCPVSLLRVHGVTMMEDYRHQEELSRGEVDDVSLETEAIATPPVHQEPVESTDEASKATEQAIPPVVPAESESVTSQPPHPEENLRSSAAEYEPTRAMAPSDASSVVEGYGNSSLPMAIGAYEPPNANMTCDSTSSAVDLTSVDGRTSTLVDISTSSHSTPSASSYAVVSNFTTSIGATKDASVNSTSPSTTSIASSSAESSMSSVAPTNATASESPGTTTGTGSSSSNQTAAASNSTRAVTSTTSSPPPAQPSTQESFFKSVHKRLQQLESNSTLSLQYIEEQSRILREAFSKVEKRQVSTTSRFLSQLNETVMVELHGFRQAYDQLWQSTVIELEGQRETYQREMLALSTRLTMVADELVWQKRMGIVQSTLLLMCLALVLFGRSSNGALEVPLMQQLLNKSTTALSGWDTPPNSPSPNSRSPVSLFRRKLWRSSTAPADPQYACDDGASAGAGGSEAGHQNTREGTAGHEIHVEGPSPPRARIDEWEDEHAHEQEGRLSSDSIARETIGARATAHSPGKKRRRGKKFAEGVMRLGSAHRSASGQGGAKSPLANGDWME